MIKVELGELLNGFSALQQLLQLRVTADLAFRFTDCWQQIKPALVNYDQRLAELREKYDVEAGAAIADTPEEFQEELEKLRAVKVPLHIEPIPRSALNGQNVQAQLLIATGFLWEQPEVDDEGDESREDEEKAGE